LRVLSKPVSQCGLELSAMASFCVGGLWVFLAPLYLADFAEFGWIPILVTLLCVVSEIRIARRIGATRVAVYSIVSLAAGGVFAAFPLFWLTGLSGESASLIGSIRLVVVLIASVVGAWSLLQLVVKSKGGSPKR